MKEYDYTIPIICSKIYSHLKSFYYKKITIIQFSAKKSKLTFFHQVINYILCWYLIFYVLPEITVNNLLTSISVGKLDSTGIIALGIFLRFFISPIVPFFDKLVNNTFEYIFKANLSTNQIILIMALSVIIGHHEINDRMNAAKANK